MDQGKSRPDVWQHLACFIPWVIITVYCRRCEMVRILLTLPFITVNWFLLLRHRPHLLSLAILTLTSWIVTMGHSDCGQGDRWQCCHNTSQASAFTHLEAWFRLWWHVAVPNKMLLSIAIVWCRPVGNCTRHSFPVPTSAWLYFVALMIYKVLLPTPLIPHVPGQ